MCANSKGIIDNVTLMARYLLKYMLLITSGIIGKILPTRVQNLFLK